jgi:hypothetical protein
VFYLSFVRKQTNIHARDGIQTRDRNNQAALNRMATGIGN